MRRGRRQKPPAPNSHSPRHRPVFHRAPRRRRNPHHRQIEQLLLQRLDLNPLSSIGQLQNQVIRRQLQRVDQYPAAIAVDLGKVVTRWRGQNSRVHANPATLKAHDQSVGVIDGPVVVNRVNHSAHRLRPAAEIQQHFDAMRRHFHQGTANARFDPPIPRLRIPAPAVMGARKNDPADAARSDQLLGRDHLRTGAPTVGDRQSHAVSPARSDHLATLGGVSRHRLLAQYVLSVLRRQAGVVAMGISRRRYDDSLHPVVAHQLRR